MSPPAGFRGTPGDRKPAVLTVHHLADGDDIWTICIKAALGNSEGLFSLQWYWDKPQTEWAEN